MSESRQLTANEIRQAVMRCFEVNRPAFIWGPPGIGKSDLVKGMAKELGGALIDLRLGQLEPTDIRGIPYYNQEDNVMDWAPPIDLPAEDGEIMLVDAIEGQLTKVKDAPVIILFLDEMNSAPPSVLAAAYQFVLNFRVGKYVLPKNVVIIAAGNRESDKGVTFRMPSPLANRFIHFEMKVDFDCWFNWAVDNNIEPDVVGYLSYAKGDLYDFDPKSSSRSFGTPRSWCFLSELIADDKLPSSVITNLAAGTVGEGLGIKFVTHRRFASKLPNPSDILDGKVTKLEVDEISAMYSLVIGMCYELKEAVNNEVEDATFNKMADNFLKYMMDNFETELVIMGARIALTKYELPIIPSKMKNFTRFHKKYGKYIMNTGD